MAVNVTLAYAYTGQAITRALSATASIVGIGTDGRTTYAIVDTRFAFQPTMTIMEGPTDLIIPEELQPTATTTFSTSTVVGGTIRYVSVGTVTASVSCALSGTGVHSEASCSGISAFRGSTTTFAGPVSATSLVFQGVEQTSSIGKPASTASLSSTATDTGDAFRNRPASWLIILVAIVTRMALIDAIW
jgi:hypothetical protein